MPIYRLVFPPPPGEPIENSPTSHEYDSGEEPLRAGQVLEVGGERWTVTEVPLDLPLEGPADVVVWRAD